MIRFPLAFAILFLAQVSFAADPEAKDGFVSLFDGKTLDGWKVGENADVFSVKDGTIMMECPVTTHSPAHLFYVGDVNHHDFKNFDLKVDVMTWPKANSGIYFHTKYQESSWPKYGMECQVDNSHIDWRRTGSLYNVYNLTWGPEKPPANNKEKTVAFDKPPVVDGEWYTQEVIYVNGKITVKFNGKTMIDFQLPKADVEHPSTPTMRWLPHGTFALQGHPPMPGHISKACFKNILVKVLPD